MTDLGHKTRARAHVLHTLRTVGHVPWWLPEGRVGEVGGGD